MTRSSPLLAERRRNGADRAYGSRFSGWLALRLRMKLTAPAPPPTGAARA